jgi:iron complex outermembrane receptor protein
MRWDVTAGLRLNETSESKTASDLTLPPFTPTQEYDAQTVSRNVARPTETVGVSYRMWAEAGNEAVLYADYRNAFKPAALDFGPDYQPAVLLPETAKMYEAGLRGAAVAGRLTFQAEVFGLDFSNLVVPTETGFLTNAAAERLKGGEFEARFNIRDDLLVAANYAYHDARFTQYLFFDADANSYVDVAGRQLPLSPRHLASAGILTRLNGA